MRINDFENMFNSNNNGLGAKTPRSCYYYTGTTYIGYITFILFNKIF